jgi:putative ABC transport system permease protein
MQVALALVVLVAAGLLTRSFVELLRVKPGFSADGVLSFQLATPRSKYDSASKVLAFYRQVDERLAAAPGVSEVGAVYPLPMSGDGWSGSFRVEGEPDGPSDPLPHAEYAVTMPGYFHALRVPLVAGRDFATTDAAAAPLVAIVDETLARTHWPNASAIGKRINTRGPDGPWATVIGVVGHVHNAGPATEGEPQLYLPFLQMPQSTMSIVVRGAGGLPPVAAIRSVIHGLDPAMPLAKLTPVADFVRGAVARERFDTFVLGAFALTALILATIGLYGVMAYFVSQRTREIGIRMALGGQSWSIRAMVLREGLLIALGGVLAGAALSIAASRFVAGLLFNLTATDPITYASIAVALLGVAALASCAPARRATRIDPVVALRD